MLGNERILYYSDASIEACPLRIFIWTTTYNAQQWYNTLETSI